MAEQPQSSLVSFNCTNCGKPIDVPARQVGQEVACPHCRAALLVPAATVEAAAPGVSVETVEARAPGQVQAAPAMDSPKVVESAAPPAPQQTPSVAPPPQTVVESRGVSMPRTVQMRSDGVTATPPQRRFAEPLPKSGSKKLVVVAIAALVVLAVAGGVGLTVKRNMDRAHKEQALMTAVLEADKQFKDGELEEAAKHAETVRLRAKELTDLGGQLPPDKEKQKSKALEQIEDYQNRLKEVAGMEAKLESDLENVCVKLRDQRTLFGSKGRQARPIVLRIEQILAKAEELQRERKLAALRTEVDEARAAWLKGNRPAASKAVSALRTRMAADDQLRNAEIEKRLNRLSELDDKVNRAEWIRVGASSNDDFAGARKQLQDISKQLDASDPAAKVVVDRIAKLISDLAREEKTRLKLTEEELTQLKRVAQFLSRREVMLQVDQGSTKKGVQLRYGDQNLRLIGVAKEQDPERLVFKINGYRLRIPTKVTQFRPGAAMEIMQALSKKLMAAGADSLLYWEIQPEAPALLAWAEEEGKVQLFYDSTLFKAEMKAPPKSEAEARKQLEVATEALAARIEKDPTVTERVAKPLVTLVRGAYKELDDHDYLPGSFCRRVLNDGYVELNVKDAGTRYKNELAQYRKAYQFFEKPSYRFKARNDAGDEVDRAVNLEGDSIIRHFDAKANRTSFGFELPIKDSPGMERPLLFVVYDFAGKHQTFPQQTDPVSVRMVHPAVGTMARYDWKAKRFEHDASRWARGAEATSYPGMKSHFGTPDWAFPPHVVLMQPDGSVTGLVTPAGRVDLPDFPRIDDMAKRRKAQDAYLDELAKVLNSTGLLHLYFLYFHQYVLDSPIETKTTLLGSRAHAGDIHQNVMQSLDRKLGGRYLGDCDDLAELYMDVTRRQGKLSYVMSLPGHAACGWVEKDQGLYRMQFIDTGPPRIVEGEDLEKVVEEGSRTYDREKTMRFDPKSVPFLFRFAGEPTRTPYWLSCRMFYDREYAEILERVQGYWHFHMYALGIKTMEEMIAKGDRVPENCVELAGLYGRVREFKKSIHWTKQALDQLGENDALSRLSEIERVAMMYREAHDYEAAYKEIEPALAELRKLSFPEHREWMRYIRQRMEYSGLLVSIHKPFKAWELFLTDLRGLGSQRRRLFIEMAAVMANILYEMREQASKPGRKLTQAEQLAIKQTDGVLNAFFRGMCFTREDDFNDNLRNYAFLGRYYGGKYGHAKLVEELLKAGPYPTKERNHQDRKTAKLEDDWAWIRLSPLSYTMAIAEAIDPDDPPEKWRKDEAAKLAEAMERAANHARKFGSLASGEFMLLSTRVLHACLVKDWKEFEGVLKEVKARSFARLTSSVAETFGRNARFLTPDEFAAQYKVFSKYVDTRAPYFNVVYEAYRAQAYEQARRAARLAVERWPDDENMKREVKFLDELIANRKKEEAQKTK